MNIHATWLYLIGTPQRAKRLLDNDEVLRGRVHKACGGTVAGRRCMRCKKKGLLDVEIRTMSVPPCPTRLLFDKTTQGRLYPRHTKALDAWDQGFITRADVIRYARLILNGGYHGPCYEGGVERG